MPYYIQLDDSDIITSCVDSSKPIDDPAMVQTSEYKSDWIGYQYNRATGVASAIVPPPAPAQPRKVTLGAFQRRIGVANSLAIAASTHKVCVALKAYMNNLDYVNLDDPETGAMLGLLVSNAQPTADLTFPGSAPLTALQVTAILSAPVTGSEWP